MKPTFNLQELIQQGDAALTAASSLLGQQMAMLDCTGVEFLTSGQMNLLFSEIPEAWDFLALSEAIESNSLSDLLAQQLNDWMTQRNGQNETEQELISTVTQVGIDQVLSFLPIFERKSNKLYQINSQQSLMEPYIYSSEVNGLLQALHDEGFILLSFDWGVWLDEANLYINDPGLLQFTNLLTLQKLLTTHVRAERFNSGNLAQLLDSGHILAVLRRLAELRQDMQEATFPVLPNRPSRITATRGDITQQQVDAIVNTTSLSLDIGGGVSEAIHAAAGPGLKEECRKLKGCGVGQAKLTRGYSLPAPWVIHTVAPVWQGGLHQEDEMLAECYRNTLALAALCPVETIAFPSIGTGFHNFPVERAAQIAATEACHFLTHNTSLEKVIFVCHSAAVFDAYSRAIKALTDASHPPFDEPGHRYTSSAPSSALNTDEYKLSASEAGESFFRKDAP